MLMLMLLVLPLEGVGEQGHNEESGTRDGWVEVRGDGGEVSKNLVEFRPVPCLHNFFSVGGCEVGSTPLRGNRRSGVRYLVGGEGWGLQSSVCANPR
jgi:hypothetical protein